MLIPKSKLYVKDNSGVLIAQCIKVHKSKKSQKPCKIGDSLKATIKKHSKKSQQVTKKVNSSTQLRDLVIIQTKKSLRRLDGSALRFNTNCGVTINSRKQPLFKRITTVVPLELKKGCISVVNLAKAVI
uniref:ribosomal protein L14 n=1 Tax=Gayralia brasiliensis TaxID=1286870 RepID=UPI0024118C0E|nr:ribosomal protein L14 [Gayralia brasiliensis]YP_010733824.1 ribosomal protein L14 [Monostroma nitidum]WEG93066.1 ribosomal protein L14 [Gayralia brasiliensis]WEG93095.1 ribosomal protein L14 [Monostroma nitidum]